MTSGNNTPEAMDPRLVEARDSVLCVGEKVIAEETGDPGQAIFVTEARVLVIKVGIAATGEVDGRVIGDFHLRDITAVNVRKGPMGAVIQIVTREHQTPAPGSPLDNVVVFTGDPRVKRCEAIASVLEQTVGKTLGRVEAQPQNNDTPAVEDAPVAAEVPAEAPPDKKPRAGRVARSLAEEMFADLGVPKPPVEEAPKPVAAVPVPISEVCTGETQAQPDSAPEPVGFAPNPNLPKPVKPSRGPLNRVLVLLGMLILALLVGVGVTAPLRDSEKRPAVNLDVGTIANNSALSSRERAELDQYQSRVVSVLKPCRVSVAKFASAVRSGKPAAIRSAMCEARVNQCYQQLNRMEAPRGLSGAKESVVSGSLAIKSALAGVAARLHSSAPIDTAEVLAALHDGQSQIDMGLSLIKRMRDGVKPVTNDK